MAKGFSNIKKEPTTVIVVSIPDNKIDALKLYIPAYANEVPAAVADLLWQIHRKISI